MSRAIDRHEAAIVELLDRIEDDEDFTVDYILETVANDHGLDADRLAQLTAVWCGIAGIANPLASELSK